MGALPIDDTVAAFGRPGVGYNVADTRAQAYDGHKDVTEAWRGKAN
jgi:hypothetical protein